MHRNTSLDVVDHVADTDGSSGMFGHLLIGGGLFDRVDQKAAARR